jgi:hypothetical protein
MDLDQVIDLFESKHTQKLSDRHAQVIIELCRQMDNEAGQTGFFYNQLDKVSRVLDLVFEGITGLKFELIPALVALLKVL